MPFKTREEYRQLLNDNEARLGDLYRERRIIMEAFSEDYEPVLPPARYRTDAQARVARCPRCGGSLAESPVEKATRERFEDLQESVASETDGAKI